MDRNNELEHRGTARIKRYRLVPKTPSENGIARVELQPITRDPLLPFGIDPRAESIAQKMGSVVSELRTRRSTRPSSPGHPSTTA